MTREKMSMDRGNKAAGAMMTGANPRAAVFLARPCIRSLCSLVLMSCAAGAPSAHGAGAIPTDKRIVARVVQALTAPSDRPMHMPTDVAIDSRGHVYVADGANDRVIRFSPEGEFNGPVEIPADQGGLSRPVGVSVDDGDHLWIADTGNHRLLVVNEAGRLEESLRLPGTLDQHPCDPTDVALSRDGKRIYVVDNDNHRVIIRERGQDSFKELGSFGESLGQFQWPFMIAVAPDGYVHVSEAIGARVQRISPRDQWAGQIGRWGMELGQLYRPKGVAVASEDRVFVSDSTTGAVQAFNARGVGQGVMTDADGKLLRFEHPMGMCFDSDGRLYVVELRANRVAVVEFADRGATATRPSPASGGGGKP